MKTTLFISLLFLFMQPVQETDKIAGVWKLAQNNTEIEMVQEGDSYTGTVVKSDAEKAIGKVILKDFKQEGDVWKGKFYAVKRDRLVDATLKETGDGTLEMEVKAGRRSKKLALTKAE